jgi:hypothetical protein
LTVECSRCGHLNEDEASFCTNCGLALGPKPALPVDALRGQARSRTGLLLMIVGFILSVIPLVSIVSIFPIIIGVIMVYMGAGAFGRTHRQFVKWSIILWTLIFLAIVVIAFVGIGQMVLLYVKGASAEELAPLWTNLTVALAAAVSALAIPHILITYMLQDRTGRIVLWGALVAHVAAVLVIAWLVLPLMNLFISAIRDGVENVVLLFEDPAVQLALVLPSLLWAVAYYLAYRRVASGKVGVAPVSPA